VAAIVTLEGTGPRAEELALEAGRAIEVPVGWDAEFSCATFDADGLDEGELASAVREALAALDPDWQMHLRLDE